MKLTNVFTHHVHFWLKDKADTAKLFEGLNSLAAIEYAKQIHIGIPADTHGGAVDDSFDASLFTIFDDLAGHDAYQIDPIHQEFLEKIARPLCAKVVVYDSVDA